MYFQRTESNQTRGKHQPSTTWSAPKNKDDVRRFMGMITYLAKFIPQLSAQSAPLRCLLEQKKIMGTFPLFFSVAEDMSVADGADS